MKSKVFILTILAVLALSLAFAGGGKPEAEKESPKEVAGKSEVKIAIPYSIPLLDPLKATPDGAKQVVIHVYDPLLKIREDGEIFPSLAADLPERVSDSSYVFTLKKGVKFHNGVELKARDVKFTVDKIFDPNYGSPYHRVFGWIDSTEVLDDYKVKFNLKVKMAPGVFNEKISGMYIVSEKVVNELGEKVTRQPIGTGPYKFVEWVEGSHVTLEKNPEYFDGTPKVDRLVFSSIPEDSVRAINLKGGKFDIVTEVRPQLVPVLEADPNINVVAKKTMTFSMLRLNCIRPPFDDKRVRQAVAYAIDQKAIAKNVHGKYGIPAEYLVPSWHRDYYKDVDKYEQNIQKARQLLKEAGYPDGFECELMVGDLSYLVQTGTLIQQMLEKVGIEAKIRLGETESLYDYVIDDSFEAFVCWSNPATVIGRDTDVFFRWQLYNGGWDNWSGEAYDEFEQLLDSALTVEDPAERQQIYYRLAEIEVEEQPIVILAYQDIIYAYNSKLKGVVYAPGGGVSVDAINAYWEK